MSVNGKTVKMISKSDLANDLRDIGYGLTEGCIDRWDQSARRKVAKWIDSVRTSKQHGVPCLPQPPEVENEYLKARLNMLRNLIAVWYYRETGTAKPIRIGRNEIDRAEQFVIGKAMTSNIDTTDENNDIVVEFVPVVERVATS